MHIADKLFNQYLKYEAGLSQNSVEAYNNDINLFFKFNHKNYLDINVSDIILFMTHLREEEYSIDSINRILSGLSAYFDYLIFNSTLQKNPVDFIDRPKKWEKLPKLLDFKEVEALIEAPLENTHKGFRDKIVIEMLYSTGARVTEVSNIKISDIDMDRGVVKIYGKGSKYRFAPLY
jgi:integrase/recombinase XerD